MKERIIETIVISSSPVRLDLYLAQRFTYLSRHAWQKQIKKGNIAVNGITTTNTHKKIHTDDRLSFLGSGRKEPDVDSDFSILYQDEYLIAVNKSGDLPVHPAGIYFNNTLTMILEETFQQKIYPVHRLDRETSGLLIMAFSADFASEIQKTFSNAVKTYTAIVHGCPAPSFTIDTPLGPDVRSKVRKKRAAYPGAPENALTECKTVSTFSSFALVNAYPKTGRLHQIRTHLLSVGHPIVGDKLYGIDENFYLEFIEHGMSDTLKKKLLMPRSALHAEELSFWHPWQRKRITLNAPLPADMQNFINQYS